LGDVFETTDVALAEHLLRESYGGNMRFDPRGRRGRIRLDQAPLTPSARLDRLCFELSFDVCSDPLGLLVITSVRSGRITYGLDGDERPCAPGDVALAVQPEHVYQARCADLDIETAVLDPALLAQVASPQPGRSTGPVRLTGYEPVSARAARRWKATYDYVRREVLDGPGAAEPLLTASAAQLLAVTALTVFPNSALTDPTIEDRRDAHPATLRRAVTFIDEHAHAGITVADIAAAANVSVRAVQLAFRRHLGTTPTGYLRRVRLENAHRELLSADPARESVTAVAHRWGFPSASRFAARYRAAYGVHPNRTLRGAPRD